MGKEKDKEKKISVLEAVETLSAIAEVDVTSRDTEGLAKEEEKELFEAHLIDPKSAIKDSERIKESFKAIHNYLKDVVDEKRFSLKNSSTQQGIKAIIEIAEEAAEKVQKYSSLFKGVQEGVTIPEFQDLYDFYLSKIVKKVETILAEEDKWKKVWEEEKGDFDLEKKSLKDLETVRKDLSYELFYIKDEGGKNYFNKNLLRHISLVGSFDEFFTALETDDPFLKVQIISDNLTHTRAKKVLDALKPHTDAFFKGAFKYKDDPYIGAIIKGYMALSLAANSQNLLQNSSSKHTSLYFKDFICFVREALETTAYHQLVKTESKDKFFMEALYLTHTFCSFIFTTNSEIDETADLIASMIAEGYKKEESLVSSPMALWHNMVNHDEKIRKYLKRFPSGPLMKALDLLRDQEYNMSFDPQMLGNFPSQLFSFSYDKLHVSVVKLPCPISQTYINEAEITEEFKGYLRHLKTQMTAQKVLIINTQDRTSWQEHSRCAALELVQYDEEFKEILTVCTFPKDGSFYNQVDDYRLDLQAEAFIKQLLEQIQSGESCGFVMPKNLNKSVLSYCKKLTQILHSTFFGLKKIFTRKNRLDFIELFYNFLFLHLIEEISPDVLCFSCKDGVDNSAQSLVSFYTALKLISKADLTLKDQEFIQWALYSNALINRERAIDIKRMSRFISACSIFHAEIIRDKKAILSSLKEVLPAKFLDTLEILIYG